MDNGITFLTLWFTGHHYVSGFSSSAPLGLDDSLFGRFSGHCKGFSIITGLCPLDSSSKPHVVTTKKVSRRCRIFPEGKMAPGWKPLLCFTSCPYPLKHRGGKAGQRSSWRDRGRPWPTWCSLRPLIGSD